ncbi:MAG TPA: LON peptidase substrate-binding domain-containing protein, partial [Candidatus Deferrimicrobium sp.]|nr:LON peptidase substrate-binding domain-containing protein [Candidatus Deferrimicrobium sp.]
MTSAPAAPDQEQQRLPVVPLRDNVVFPHQLAPLAAGRPRSVAGLQAAVNGDARVILAVQRQAEPDDVGFQDLHEIAVVATVGALRLIPGAGAHALVEGQQRIRLLSFDADGEQWSATYELIDDGDVSGTEADALAGSVRELYADYVTAGGQVSPEVAAAMARATGPARVADIASAAPDLTVAERVELLQSLDVVERLRRLAPLLGRQVEVASMRSRIHEDVQRTINKSQREHILREQLRAVRKELAELDGEGDDSEDLVARVEALSMPPDVKARALKEVSRLEQISGASPEMGMVRTWVDWLLDLPWGERPTEHIDIQRAAAILDEDHYGLAKVKDRILEWMAVRDRAQRRAAALAAAAPAAGPASAGDPAETLPPAGAPPADPMVEATTRPPRVLQTPILCLVGPPGVGKTSLGRSIARAMDRRFVRLSLGGIRDEAEIRGHRRTYIGALPGRIIQSMKQAGTVNPV